METPTLDSDIAHLITWLDSRDLRMSVSWDSKVITEKTNCKVVIQSVYPLDTRKVETDASSFASALRLALHTANSVFQR